MIPKELFEKIRHIQIKTEHSVENLLAGSYHSAFKGRGMEFEDSRDYQAGDDIRDIDWNATARMNKPFVKHFREERELTVILAVDISGSLKFGSTEQSKLDCVTELAALLAFSAMRNNDKVALLLFADGIELYLPPKKSLKHILHILRELLIPRPKPSGTNIEKALVFLNGVQKKRSICFLMSDLMAPLPKQALSITAKRHDFITLCVRDKLEAELPDLGLMTLRDPETGLIKVVDSSHASNRLVFNDEMQKHLNAYEQHLRRNKANFIFLEAGESYVEKLSSFFNQRKFA